MWKLILRIVVVLVCLAVVLAGGGIGYLYLGKPAQAPPSAIKVALTPERIARGQYIFSKLADCDGCHSQRDFSLVGGPIVVSGRGRGNLLSDLMIGMPGTVVAPNLTPDPETGLGAWTDGEKIRAIREGVDRTGRVLFPMMPYTQYRKMSDEDVQSVVAFLDSLPPVKNPLPITRLDFPVSMFVRLAPQPAGSVPTPGREDRLKYGEYLATIAGCADCHTPLNKGQQIPGKTLAGGEVFTTKLGTVVTANITPDLETGIGKWSEEFFLKKFYDYKEYFEKGAPKLPGPEAFTLMPWFAFSQLPTEDLGAIYTYLRTAAPVHNYVEIHPGHPNKTGMP